MILTIYHQAWNLYCFWRNWYVRYLARRKSLSYKCFQEKCINFIWLLYEKCVAELVIPYRSYICALSSVANYFLESKNRIFKRIVKWSETIAIFCLNLGNSFFCIVTTGCQDHFYVFMPLNWIIIYFFFGGGGRMRGLFHTFIKMHPKFKIFTLNTYGKLCIMHIYEMLLMLWEYV